MKLRQFFKLAGKVKLDKMLTYAKDISVKTGKPKLFILADMTWCALRYSAGYVDYSVFEFYNIDGKHRKTYITRGINNEFIRKFNDREYWHLFDNKDEFNDLFSIYLKRSWLNFLSSDADTVFDFVKRYGKVISKPRDSSCGKGIIIVNADEWNDAASLYKMLEENACGVLEEIVVQHPLMASLYPHSVNTLRISTVANDSGVYPIYALIRMGNGGKFVDNLNSGGMAAPVDLKSGVISMPAADKNAVTYSVHPQTNAQITGFSIPFWQEALDMCIEGARVVPQIRYIAWDIAITEDGPLMIEGNHFPGHDIIQLPAHSPDKTGLLPLLKKHLY